MYSSEELYRIIIKYGKMLRESTGDAKIIYGEVYEDAVFGILLSAVPCAGLRKEIADKAFENYRKGAAMCISLEREEIAFSAMNTALEKGIAAAVKIHLGVSADEKVLEKYLAETGF